jgi:hypothetical protein
MSVCCRRRQSADVFERRNLDYDDALNRLHETLAPLAGLDLEDLCDRVLANIAGDHPEDDIALIALRR